ncbi:M48 family metallopeptidase [Sphingomonas sp. LY160]|uniref:M48 family metallopeptidase n=1 Tax=Sphingomonas sp. LY160 TaxID=3095342 RepID=UPI002ADEDC79|nr:M48 family metallopeptidase [Sphingomonas sp. LY160]MEA1072570.1 M48 family metallopeptidase [Sphingomonas sp. LY160]
MSRGIYYDGVTAERHEVSVAATNGTLSLTGSGISPIDVPASELQTMETEKDRTLLGRAGHPGWRLTLQQPIDPTVASLLPRAGRYGGFIDRVGLPRATAVLAGVAAVVLFVGYSAPAWLAPIVPESWERNLGTAIVGDFGDNACRSPAAARALEAMAARIEPDRGTRAPIPMTLIDVGIFNAAALPGGQVVIFDGALKETPNPDAMAGVLAHEIAHVRRRHVTQALIRELGIGALIRLFAGDIGANAQQIVSLNYTRANENEADADALVALQRAGIDPRPTAALFTKLGKDSGGFDSVEWLNSHPRSADRAKRFAAAWKSNARYTPVLSAADYRAIRLTCPEKRRAEREAEKE